MNIVGAISTCYVCAKMLKETKNKATAAEKLSSCLGIPTESKILTKKGEDKGKKYSRQIDYNHALST